MSDIGYHIFFFGGLFVGNTLAHGIFGKGWKTGMAIGGIAAGLYALLVGTLFLICGVK